MFKCKYCNKECKNANSLRNHERLCKLNPNHQTTVFSTDNPQKKHAWNKGLNIEDERIRNLVDGVKKYYTTHPGVQTGKPRTEEEKRKISETARKNKLSGGYRQGSGRGHKGKYRGYYCDSTYELVYVIYNLDHNIKFDRCPISYTYTINGIEHQYHPDFILEDGSLIEIKGYHTSTVDVKLASVTDRKIRVLYEKDLQYAFDYVKNTYNYNHIEDLYDKEDDLGAAS